MSPQPPLKKQHPLDAPLPPLAVDESPLTPSQWETLLAIADALVPGVQSAPSPNQPGTLAVSSEAYAAALASVRAYALHDEVDSLAVAYLAERPSQLPAFKEQVARALSTGVPVGARSQLARVLDILNTRLGAFIFTGYATPIAALPIADREAVLKSWTTAKLPLFRGLFCTFASLARQSWVRTSPTLSKVLSFPRVPVHLVPGQSFPFEFLQFSPGDDVVELETDVVIIGSGCGGAVAAKNLAEAGHRVLVVEEKYHWPAQYLPMTESDGFEHLFMQGGSIVSDDRNAVILAGAAWGGGGTVNWSASLQPQHYVREEWAAQGLPFFTSLAFQKSLDRVCERMGASTEYVEHNKTNRVLLEGGRKLGLTVKPVPQNTGGKKHYCGYCTLGCGACEKQGPVVSFLPDAAKAGAKFIEGFRAERIVFDREENGEKVASGVEGVWTSRDEHGGVAGIRQSLRVVIKARRVVVSGGSLQSPLLLRRSGLTNPHIGRNLKIHPVSTVGAIYDEEVRPWEGGILTAVATDFQNLDGQGHGVKLEAITMIPSFILPVVRWTSGLDYKTFAPKFKHMVGYISLARDKGSGSVFEDRIDGRARIRYPVDPIDRAHIIEGVIALAKMNYIEGARVIFSADSGVAPFERRTDTDTQPISYTDDADFQAFLNAIRTRGLPTPEVTLGSAHQMGSCRMAASPEKGVVDPKGKVWGTRNVFVCDASVFPSASGVNPMVTNMGIADWVCGALAREMK